MTNNVIRLPVEWHHIPICDGCGRRSLRANLWVDTRDGAEFMVCPDCRHDEYAEAIGLHDLVEEDGRIITGVEADAHRLPKQPLHPAGYVMGWCISGNHGTVVAYLLRNQDEFHLAELSNKVRCTRRQWLEGSRTGKTRFLPCKVCDRVTVVKYDGIEVQ